MSEERKKAKLATNEFSTLLDLLGIEGEREIVLEDVEINANELVLYSSGLPSRAMEHVRPAVLPPVEKPKALLEASFTPFLQEYPGSVREVTLGATKNKGGSRGKTVTIGGATTPAFYLFEKTPAHSPAISIDVFDMKISLPKAIRMHVEEVWDDPVAWAKMAVDKWNVDLLTIHLLSTDPLINDTSPKEAAKTVEEVLQAVDVPLIIGGCGDPKKDAELFTKIAEVASGERILINSLTLDMDEAGVLEGVAKAAGEHDQLVLAFTALDLNRAKELNRKLYEFIPEENIIMDMTTAALGYGLEYSFTIHERARMSALMGDKELQHPTLSGTTNAWAAREAWMKMGPEWEPKEQRGPLWECDTALILLLAGVDLFMMMHPAAINTMKTVINEFMNPSKAQRGKIDNWVSS
ncbi:MAG: CO dehydrogenase/acetyl-CoA synthase subunit delta [Promethearchaeota archaeon]